MSKTTTKSEHDKIESGHATQRRHAEAELSSGGSIQIARIDTETMIVHIVGTMPLIVHNFSEKSKRAMLEAQIGIKRPKEKRDPKAEYEAAFYKTKDGYGFPVTAFKAATVGAARFYGKDVK